MLLSIGEESKSKRIEKENDLHNGNLILKVIVYLLPKVNIDIIIIMMMMMMMMISERR